MPLGVGKYDDELAAAIAQCGATSGILIIVDGNAGPGMSCQASLNHTLMLPEILRLVAVRIEASYKNGEL